MDVCELDLEIGYAVNQCLNQWPINGQSMRASEAGGAKLGIVTSSPPPA